MVFKNKTLYNQDLIVKYNNYYIRSYLQKNFIIMSLITLSFIIYMLSINQWQYALLLFGILVIYLVGTYFMQKTTTNRMLKKSPLVEKPVLQVYEFTDNQYTVTNIQSNPSDYSNLKKIRKSKDFFILITKDNRRLILDKSGFETDNQAIEFEDFIKDKIKIRK